MSIDDDAKLQQAATDHAQAEYDRLIAAGWSRREAASYSREAQRSHLALLRAAAANAQARADA